ncbi:G protein-activated inward rectifier potassium channel 3 isoform X2 [Diabrotica virgifera virgifera]|uniref:G protein-activated inward rectifier potassium channel 3-like isoform X2 n=1 Tax=Diabrotica virgifera virgifera TaxID=50390 RepID=A0A6P7FF01_DIAVI|nr:G protein-activated inward rectifier potassium channel 3 isoform X2 [Diabrotica virgifera virgifera]
MSTDGSDTTILIGDPSTPGNILVTLTDYGRIETGFYRPRNQRIRRSFRPNAIRKMRRRAVFKNGDCNILQSRISKRRLRYLQDIFTTLVDSQWRWTLTIFAIGFLGSWLLFALVWWLIVFTHGDLEEDHLPAKQAEANWTPCVFNIQGFTSCFLFSIETQHTIGYGVRTTTEECPEAIFLMCLQSIAGMIIQAFMVGIVFAKMTRPKLRTQTLQFSKNVVICQREGHLCLMFRVGDMRKSHIIGASIRAQLIRSKTTKEGEVLSNFQTELDVNADGCDGNLFFIWPMTIVHRIDENSPFYFLTASDMLNERFEIVVILEGTIESTGQTTQARSSYVASEVLWGHRFESVVSYNKDRQGYEVNYSKFDNTVAIDTPLCSGADLSEFYRIQQISDVDMRFLSPYRLSPSNSFLVQSAPISRVPSLEPLFKKEPSTTNGQKTSLNQNDCKIQIEDSFMEKPYKELKPSKESKSQKECKAQKEEAKRKISAINAVKRQSDILEEKEEEEEQTSVTENLI